VETQVEELAGDKVKLSVEVPTEHLQHAVEHAASDLAASLRIPGFRKGKVPMPVLFARVGKERVYTEAVESHIRGWFVNAASDARIRPVAQPDYEYEVPESLDGTFRFTATVAVQPKVEVADWATLEVGRPEPDVPREVVDAEVDALRSAVAELVPVEGRPAALGDVVVVDITSAAGETSGDTVVEVGGGRLVEEIEATLVGMSAGESKEVSYEIGEQGETRSATVTVKEVKEKVLPPLDDDLAKAASEFETLDELRSDIESRMRAQIEAEIDAQFRVAAVDALVEASDVMPAEGLIRSRATGLLGSLVRSLEGRGISLETYLAATGQTSQQVQERMVVQAAVSLARELALEAVADKLSIEVSDDELGDVLRDQGEPEATVDEVLASTMKDDLREDMRLRKALDRVAAEVKPIPVDLARAREKLWTPGKEKVAGDANIWTPGSKEPA
jgi:trigger factor